jgi:uncharacterized protein (TIGR04141 family)
MIADGRTGMPRSTTYSLYRAKAEVAEFDDLLTTTARGYLGSSSCHRISSDTLGDGGVLYTFAGHRNVPKWVATIGAAFTPPENLFSQSACAIVAFRKEDAVFALTFGHAHVYLDDARTEADFGLRVAINATSDEQLRSVESSNIGAAIREFAQAAGQRDLRSFGFDEALDLVRKVSGYAADGEFAGMVTGARALRFTKEMDITEVPAFAIEADGYFRSAAYQDTSFKIIDFLSPVLDPSLVDQLDELLVASIRGTDDDFEIALPDIVPDESASFRFERVRFSDLHPDLSLDLYREAVGDFLSELTIKDLKTHSVAAFSEDDDRPFKHWSVHRALVGSLVLGRERYALNEGFWYRVGTAIKEAADSRFVELCCEPDRNLLPLRKIAGTPRRGRTKAGYQSEESYNEEMAVRTGYLLMDKKLVQIDEVPGPGIEVCDLLDIPGRRFIHIKKSSRQSSVLSHFFKQGKNAARMVRWYEPFKTALIDAVRSHHGDEHAEAFGAALADRWAVEFRIADFPRANGQHNIPFFSKLTLQDEARELEGMDFDVRVGFIKLARIEQTVSPPSGAGLRN